MQEEYNALIQNGTRTLVPAFNTTNIVGSKWVFILKLNLDGFLEWYKAYLVANMFNLEAGTDYHDKFSPLVKPTTI